MSVNCTLFQIPNQNGTACVNMIDEIPSAPIALWFLSTFLFIMHTGITLVSINRLQGIWIQYRWKSLSRSPVQPPWRDLRTYSLLCKCVSSILMMVAYIDMFGLQGIWTMEQYLGMYSLPYAMIPLSTMFLQLNFVDRIYIQQKMTALTLSKSYSVLTIAFLILTSLYSFGYIIFGLYLGPVLSSDPNSTLGVTGNILAIVSYVLLIINCIFCMGPSIWMMLKVGLFGLSRSEDLTKHTNNLITWTCRIGVVSALNIINLCMFSYIPIPATMYTGVEMTEAIVRGLLPTVFALMINRFLEVAIDWIDLDMMSYEALEMFPGLENWIMLHYGDGLGRYSAVNTGSGRTATLSRVTKGSATKLPLSSRDVTSDGSARDEVSMNTLNRNDTVV